MWYCVEEAEAQQTRVPREDLMCEENEEENTHICLPRSGHQHNRTWSHAETIERLTLARGGKARISLAIFSRFILPGQSTKIVEGTVDSLVQAESIKRFIEGQAFLLSSDSAPRPPPPLPLSGDTQED